MATTHAMVDKDFPFGQLEKPETIGGKWYRIQEFWVVITATLLKLNEADQTAELDVYTKWFWYDKDFLARIPLGQVKLEGKPPVLLEAFKNGDRVYGCWPDGGTGAFPVNIKKMFHNQIGEYKRHSAWTRFEEEKELVSVQHAFSVTVRCQALTDLYPFDQIVVPLRLAIRESKRKENVPNAENVTSPVKVSTTWRLMENHNKYTEYPEYKEDKYAINSKKSPLQFLETIIPRVGYELTDEQKTKEYLTKEEKKEKRRRPIPCLLFQRNPSHFLLNIVLPLFLIVLGCLSVLCLNVYEFNTDRFSAMLTGLLTVAAFKTSIQKDLPTTDFLTIADKYILACFVFLLLALAKLVIVAHINGDASGIFVHVSPEKDWEMSHQAMVFDDISTWILIGLWIIINLVLGLFGKIVLREPWKRRVDFVCSNTNDDFVLRQKLPVAVPDAERVISV
mmetsp:Transcript_17191/g.22359  ORF Transcript_17191/g.22359 Transcript_17191/m.22359 type:complete len:449 (+) Transcript_17191:75-1421(+)